LKDTRFSFADWCRFTYYELDFRYSHPPVASSDHALTFQWDTSAALERGLSWSYSLRAHMSSRGFRSVVGPAVRAALGSVSLLMLLAFPLQRMHSFSAHFRAHEVRRSVMRRISLERTTEGITVEEARECPTGITCQVEDRTEFEPIVKRCTLSPVIATQPFLTRLKLGSAHTGDEDPLPD
jgi:hypothetical protein